MTDKNRRSFLRQVASTAGSVATLSAFPPAIQKALAIPAHHRTGTIRDVEHIVILTQENRAFDHYFGSLNGVRGFADRFPIPVASVPGIQGKNVWYQPNETAGAAPAVIAPFHLNTEQRFEYMRVEGTPHSWANAQHAWGHGQMNAWPLAKHNHSMGYFSKDDLPFQYAMANAFTICDAYHCSFQGGTNPNRLFLQTGMNDPLRTGHGPATYNDYDWFDADRGDGGYSWTTYPERLEAAGVSWQVYENMEDNFTDNSLAGFKVFRDAFYQRPGYSEALRARGVSTRDLDKLKEDVLAGKLPQVSWIVATAEGSEHPGPSSPAQGADYTAKVLEALTANPEVWSKTVLFINFDENDGFFDHVPPPAVPSYLSWNADPRKAVLAGASTVSTVGEYHEFLNADDDAEEVSLQHRAYGLGPRVPMYVISPWTKGGWVNSEVFDHTSTIRFVEQRFGVKEPNISAWRRAVCGDLSSAFNFADPDNKAFFSKLPQTLELAERARGLPGRTRPPVPDETELPEQEAGIRPSRALPYELHVSSSIKRDLPHAQTSSVVLKFANTGRAGAVFHVYDRLNLGAIPRRYTVEAGKHLEGSWKAAATGAYDLWVLGPNGFHRHFTGNLKRVGGARQPQPEIRVHYEPEEGRITLKLVNSGSARCTFSVAANEYFNEHFDHHPETRNLGPRDDAELSLPLHRSGHWYDFTVTVSGLGGFSRRFAGRMETGKPSISDPAMDGAALGDQLAIGND